MPQTFGEAIQSATTMQILEWIFDHITIGLFIAVLTFMWKFRGAIDKFQTSWDSNNVKLASVEKMSMETLGDVNIIQTNHLVHLAESCDKTATSVQALTECTRSLADSTKTIIPKVDEISSDVKILKDRGKTIRRRK